MTYEDITTMKGNKMKVNEVLKKLENREITFKDAYELCGEFETKQVSEMKIFRTYSAGVFAGYQGEVFSAKHMIVHNARRLWYWKGAASLSQLAIDGVKYPDECKFPEAVSRIELTEVVEILDVTEEAKNSIDGVPTWKV